MKKELKPYWILYLDFGVIWGLGITLISFVAGYWLAGICWLLLLIGLKYSYFSGSGHVYKITFDQEKISIWIYKGFKKSVIEIAMKDLIIKVEGVMFTKIDTSTVALYTIKDSIVRFNHTWKEEEIEAFGNYCHKHGASVELNSVVKVTSAWYQITKGKTKSSGKP